MRNVRNVALGESDEPIDKPCLDFERRGKKGHAYCLPIFFVLVLLLIHPHNPRRLCEAVVVRCNHRTRWQSSKRYTLSQADRQTTRTCVHINTSEKTYDVTTYLLPFLNPPMMSEFQRGLSFVRRPYMTCDRYSCISTGPSSCPSCAAISSTTISSSNRCMY